MVQAARHAHEAENVDRHERDEETDEPADERVAAELFVELEAEHLRPPELHAREVAEHHAADNGVMEVSDQEQAVMQHEVRARDRQHHARHAAERERDDEADGPQNRRGELHAPRYIVKSQLKIFTPVGIEMIIVMMPKKALTFAPEPMVKKWCSHTRNDSTMMQHVAQTIVL